MNRWDNYHKNEYICGTHLAKTGAVCQKLNSKNFWKATG